MGEHDLNIQKAYDHWSSTYDVDRNLTRDLDALAVRKILCDLKLKSVLEIGCGTGKNTAHLARIARRVYALDFSEGMIEQAKAKVSLDNVSFDFADLTKRWPCGAGLFEMVVCNLVLEHVADLDFIFRQAHRILAPGGTFFISELHPFRQYQGKQAIFRQRQKTVAIPSFVHNVSDFIRAAQKAGFTLNDLQEWWHESDQGKPPRLISFIFKKAARPTSGGTPRRTTGRIKTNRQPAVALGSRTVVPRAPSREP